MNINNPTTFSTPDLTLSTSNSSGSAGALRADDTIAVFDTTVPANITTGSASTGSAESAARRDHVHNAGTVDTNGMVLIGSATASSSSTLGISGLDSSYDTYLLSCSDIALSGDAEMALRLGDSSGIDSGSTDYSYILGRYKAGTASEAIDTSATHPKITLSVNVGGATLEGFGCNIWITQPGDTSSKNRVFAISSYQDGSGDLNGAMIFGGRNANIALTQVQIFPASGNIATGRLTVWGYSHG